MAVTVNDVSASIRGVTVLDHVSATFENGRISGLVGPNGSGKTMLLRVIAGLVRPSGGTVSVDGATLWRDVSFPPDVGLLIESPHFLDDRTGLENLLILASIREVVGPEEVRDAISAFGLDPDDPRRFSKYSLGMKQRLGIAMALLGKPEFLFLDEPLNGLDPEGIRDFRELMLRLNQEQGTTILISSHQLRELTQIATCYGFIDKGKMIEQITAQELEEKTSDGDLEGYFLSLIYKNKLIKS